MINIFELRINGDYILNDLYVKQLNNVATSNYKNLYKFLNCFFNNTNSTVYIENKKIDSKTSYIVNLLDYEGISNQLVLKKGTLIYDYLFDEVSAQAENADLSEKINFELKKLFEKTIMDKTIDYSIDFDADFTKIMSNYIIFDIDLEIDNYIKIIKKLIQNIQNKKMKKTILILVNTHIFGDTLDDIENGIIFKFNTINFPNILISNRIVNIDKDLLINQLHLNWPCEISNSEISKYLNYFFAEYSEKLAIITSDYKKYTAYKLIEKILAINVDCTLEVKDEDNIPNLYKNFMQSLQ